MLSFFPYVNNVVEVMKINMEIFTELKKRFFLNQTLVTRLVFIVVFVLLIYR